MIIALVNRKGGSAKTTSCIHLASVLKSKGSVCCLDSDNEQSLFKWHSTGSLDFDVFSTSSDNLKKDIETYSKKYDYVLLDTPPNDDGIVLKAAALSDECIVPCNATISDLLRIVSTLDSLATIEQATGKALTSVLLVRAKKGTNILEEVKQSLIDEKIPLCDTVIYDSVKYQGDTPIYLEEYQALIQELGF